MAPWSRVSRGVAAGAVAVTTLLTVPCVDAVAADGGATASPTSSPTPTPTPTGTPTPTPSSTPSPSSTPAARPTPGSHTPASVPSLPGDAELARARDAASAAAREVADITAKVQVADARLEALQKAVAEAVTAQDVAEQQLADAEAAVEQAGSRLGAARRTREQTDRTLSGIAALIYMQGGDLQNLTGLLLTPPDAMADLAVVLDGTARQARESLDAATSAAEDAAAAAREAAARRTAAEQEAAKAGAEAARLGQEQEALTARLVELGRAAADLAGRREAAALLGGTDLLGLQAADGSAPHAAQQIALAMMPEHHWDGGQFGCLLALWTAESGWSWSATNPSSGAYGIPQALPGWKMASAGSDWLTNPATQITWGLDYIASVYGSPCEAYTRFLARSPHWY